MEQNNTLQEIKSRLKDYLTSQNIELTGTGRLMFKCIAPDHKDNNPSCGIVAKNPEVFHCFSCGFNGNIFHAAFLLEGMPRQGKAFFAETVKTLAERFDIPYEEVEMSEEDRRIVQMQVAYRDATAAISRDVPKLALYLEVRGWTEELGAKFSLGTVSSFEAYCKYMNSLGWGNPYLKSIGLQEAEIFDPDSLIFPIHDHHGNPVAFGRRWMDWKSKADPRKKYHNSYESEIYNKTNLLYNLHRVRRGRGPVVLVEGYTDVIGLTKEFPDIRAVAICGTSFTSEQLSALREHKMMTVELALDGDEPGQLALQRVIETFSKDSSGFLVKVVEVTDGEDPGSCAKSWKDLPRYTPFEWSLMQIKDESGQTPEEMCQASLPTVMLEPDRIQRYQMVRELSNVTGLPKTLITDEIERRYDQKAFQRKERENSIRENLMTMIRKGRPLSEIISEGQLQKQTLESEYNDIDTTTEEYYTEELQRIWTKSESDEPDERFHVADMPVLMDWMSGFPTTQMYQVVGGIPHSGKTSLLRMLAWNIAKNNTNATVIYHNIDEPIFRMLPAIVAIESEVAINQVKHLNNNSDDEIERIRNAWQITKDMGMAGRFVIKDARAGSTIDHMERMIRSYQDKYPDRKLIYFFDNFHKLQDYPETDTRKKYEACSKRLKHMTLIYDFPLITTAELRKIDSRKDRVPRSDDIKETGTIYYDSDVMWLIHNDLNVDPDTEHAWTRSYSGGREQDIYNPQSVSYEQKKPILDIIWAKNRETGKLGKTHYKYDPAKNLFKEVKMLPRPIPTNGDPTPDRKVDRQNEFNLSLPY